MTLSDFILAHLDALLDDWATFARSIPAARDLDLEGLRDHAEAMLRVIALDMRSAQTADEQQRKSEGHGPRASATDSAAESHGSSRRQSGFELMQMVMEFRALRATVVRQWLAAEKPSGAQPVQELVRFNEALDQALTESLARFVLEIDEARGLFMGVVSHDMRNPIAASINAARYLQHLPGLDATASNAIDIVHRSNERLSRLTEDLLEFVRLKLHHPSVASAPVDLHALCSGVLATLRMSHPGTVLILSRDGDTHGQWDGPALERLVSNLVENALKHGTGTTAELRLRGEPDSVQLTVWNPGDPIPADRLARIFEPLTTWSHGSANGAAGSYGLGLYIAREIARGHAGSIRADSDAASGTTFTVRLPRRPPPLPGAAWRPDRARA